MGQKEVYTHLLNSYESSINQPQILNGLRIGKNKRDRVVFLHCNRLPDLTGLIIGKTKRDRVLCLHCNRLPVLTGLRIGKNKTGRAEKAMRYRQPSLGITTTIARITSTAAPIAKNIWWRIIKYLNMTIFYNVKK